MRRGEGGWGRRHYICLHKTNKNKANLKKNSELQNFRIWILQSMVQSLSYSRSTELAPLLHLLEKVAKFVSQRSIFLNSSDSIMPFPFPCFSSHHFLRITLKTVLEGTEIACRSLNSECKFFEGISSSTRYFEGCDCRLNKRGVWNVRRVIRPLNRFILFSLSFAMFFLLKSNAFCKSLPVSYCMKHIAHCLSTLHYRKGSVRHQNSILWWEICGEKKIVRWCYLTDSMN